ncbi:MAG TPA: permease-like cell division protein FtsX [Gemmatimonadales bacterium]|nr:permease-like cell division protein FtsX [Gemmatimonadales bacterium]
MLTLREAWRSTSRSPLLSILGVATIAFSLFAFGIFGLVALNIREALVNLEERVEVRVFLNDDVTYANAVELMDRVKVLPEVAQVDYVSREAALTRAREELGEFRDVFESDFLPTSVEVRLHEGARDPATVERVAVQLEGERGVEEVRYGEDWVEKLHEIRNLATAIGLALGAVFALIAIIIIGATIRMSVLARAREIGIMRLVGATDWFIRRPFLLDGLMKGLMGGLLALLMTWGAHRLVNQYVIETVFFDWRTAAIGIAAGATLGLLGSMLSIGRHLRRI